MKGCLLSYGAVLLGGAVAGLLLGLVRVYVGPWAMVALLLVGLATLVAVFVRFTRRLGNAKGRPPVTPYVPVPPRVTLNDSEWRAIERTRADGRMLREGRCPRCDATGVAAERGHSLSTSTVDAQGNRGGFIQVQVTFRCGACAWMELAFVVL